MCTMGAAVQHIPPDWRNFQALEGQAKMVARLKQPNGEVQKPFVLVGLGMLMKVSRQALDRLQSGSIILTQSTARGRRRASMSSRKGGRDGLATTNECRLHSERLCRARAGFILIKGALPSAPPCCQFS